MVDPSLRADISTPSTFWPVGPVTAPVRSWSADAVLGANAAATTAATLAKNRPRTDVMEFLLFVGRLRRHCDSPEPVALAASYLTIDDIDLTRAHAPREKWSPALVGRTSGPVEIVKRGHGRSATNQTARFIRASPFGRGQHMPPGPPREGPARCCNARNRGASGGVIRDAR